MNAILKISYVQILILIRFGTKKENANAFKVKQFLHKTKFFLALNTYLFEMRL